MADAPVKRNATPTEPTGLADEDSTAMQGSFTLKAPWRQREQGLAI